VGLFTVFSLFLVMSASAQEVAPDCDPAADPTCQAQEAGAEPSGESDSAEEASTEEAGSEDIPADEADPAEAPSVEAGGEATESDTAEAEKTTAEETELSDSEPADTEATAGAEAEVAEPVPTNGESTDAADAAPGAEPAEGETAQATHDGLESLEIVEPETVLSEDTGLTEEAASAEAAAAEELSDTAPVAAASESGATAGASEDPEAEIATVTEEEARSSEEGFPIADGGDDGLSTLEKLLIAGVGAAIVGELIDDNRIVQNTGDRVVLQRADGSLYVLRDDDVLLRRPGYEVATRTYSDGSTVSEIAKPDGSIVRTIKDRRGNVLRRTRILPSGVEIILFDDTTEFEPVVVESLPLRRSASLDYASSDLSLEDALAAGPEAEIGRRFSLSQIRNIRAVRELVPVIDLEAITFETGSAAIRASEASRLDRLGEAMKTVIETRPFEVFLIEGHTDAVGSSVANLTLSDRRAESLALALTEYFDIPSENLVVQGYGERYLKVPVETDERANRRVTVRRITPLLGMESASGAGTSTDLGGRNSAAPAEFAIFGDGYPSAGSPCSRSGESNFTREFLDDSADLVACPPSVDPDQFVANLGGEKLSTRDGWTLILVPQTSQSQGDGLPRVGSAEDLSEFEGARAGQAEVGIQALGYEAIRSEGLTTFWYNRETGACAQIVTTDGRYAKVEMLASEDC